VKIAPKNIDSFVKKPPPALAALLLYGPDEGLIRERMNLLTGNIVADIRDPFNVVELSARQLSENPARLMDEALSISMLGGRRVVRVHGAGDDMAPVVKSVLAALKPADNLVLLGAGELSPRSSLRLLFENAENGAAIPCYVEDERDIGRVIRDSLKTAGYTIPAEAIAYMAGNVVGDRAVARSEVEKLITYMGAGKKSISLDDVIACVGSSAALSLDDLGRHVASGRFAEAERILDHVLSEGIPAVTVLRNLQNYFLRLHISKARLQRGETMEDALKKLRPPLFFKIKSAFESQLSAWSLNQLEQALALLSGAEAKCKQTANDPHTLCSRAVLSLSQIGAKAAGVRRRA
jgi:DNA polymerase-3 subunit delta